MIKAILFAATILLSAGSAQAYGNLNCTTDYFGSTTCRGYDYNHGGYTAEETPLGEVRIKTDSGNTFTCSQYGGCRGGY